MPRKSAKFGIAGNVIGCLCLATLYLIEMYGPNSYSGSWSGMLRADGTVVELVSIQPVLPRIAQAAFFLFAAALVLGVVAVFRKENIFIALGAFCFGLTPIIIYTLGVFFASMLYFGIALPAFALYAFNRFGKT
jgi:hypothetical protein